MIQGKLLTKKAVGIIEKKLRNERLTQQDSNYLSRFVRPKLREMALINSEYLLGKLDYNPKARSIENRIKKIVLGSVKDVDAIIICGSAIQTNYRDYNDIDVIIATNRVIAKSIKEKNKLINKIEEEGKKQGLTLDVQIYAKHSIVSQYSYSPSLISQLEDSKVIYGNLKIPSKIKLSRLDLKMKLDWSEIFDESSGKDIYFALRNAILVLLLMNKKVDNYQLNNNLVNTLGPDLVSRLKNNQASKEERKLALAYLKLLTNYLEMELNKTKWENIKIENH